MAEREELLPCPFCGSAAEYDSQRWRPAYRAEFKSLTGHAITCSTCEAEIGLFECYEDAAAAWNRRILPLTPTTSQVSPDAEAVARSVMAAHRGDVTGKGPHNLVDWEGLTRKYTAAITQAVERERKEILRAIFVIRDKYGRSLDWCNALNAIQDVIRARSQGGNK